ncbi:MAG: hypothetical protein ABTQ73_06170 [Caldilineales bacterium]
MWNRLIVVLGIFLALLGMTACSKAGETNTPTPLAVSTPAPAPFEEVAEMQVAQAADPLPDGAAENLTGLYGTASAGERQLLLCTLDGLVISCQRYAITLEGTAPGVVRVSGEIRNGQLVASKSESPAWDEPGQRAVAEAKLQETIALLERYDWSLLAKPEYTEVSAWFRPSAAQLSEGGLILYGYDRAHDWLIWRTQGAEMSKPEREVFRYPVIYVVTDPAGEYPAQSIVTIEGRVEE